MLILGEEEGEVEVKGKYKILINLLLIIIFLIPINTNAAEANALYRIKYGDTLYSIATSYDVGLDRVVANNNIAHPDHLYPGQMLYIPDQTLGLKKTLYQIRYGDSLYKISRKFNMGIDEIKRLNNLKDNTIYAGNFLIVVPNSSELHIDVNIQSQIMRVYYKDIVVKEMDISSGLPGYDTPKGHFEVQNRGDWFYSEKYQEGAKYWVSFLYWGKYLFHTVPMDRDENVIEEEAAKIGQRASHGCIRLKIPDAKWLYDNIPIKAKVYIH